MENIAKEIRIIVSAKIASKPKTSDEFLLSMYDLLKTYNTMINEMDLYDINEKYHSLFPLDKNEIDVINIEEDALLVEKMISNFEKKVEEYTYSYWYEQKIQYLEERMNKYVDTIYQMSSKSYMYNQDKNIRTNLNKKENIKELYVQESLKYLLLRSYPKVISQLNLSKKLQSKSRYKVYR